MPFEVSGDKSGPANRYIKNTKYHAPLQCVFTRIYTWEYAAVGHGNNANPIYESSFFKNSSFRRVETSISELSLISTNPPFPLL